MSIDEEFHIDIGCFSGIVYCQLIHINVEMQYTREDVLVLMDVGARMQSHKMKAFL